MVKKSYVALVAVQIYKAFLSSSRYYSRIERGAKNGQRHRDEEHFMEIQNLADRNEELEIALMECALINLASSHYGLKPTRKETVLRNEFEGCEKV